MYQTDIFLNFNIYLLNLSTPISSVFDKQVSNQLMRSADKLAGEGPIRPSDR